jgi:ribosome-associated protein
VLTDDSRVLVVNSRIEIPRDEFQFTYVRSSGPGGQNVNKVNSKAVLRWAILTSPSLPEDVRRRFLSQFRSRVTDAGDVVISSQEFRDQSRNVAECLEKLRSMIASVAVAPRPRRRTKPSRGSIERRLNAKKRRSQTKSGRRDGGWAD